MFDELVSIIMPSYNSARFIGKTIESIIGQTYTNWELLITDDCSKDDTVRVVQGYVRQDSRIKLFRMETNGGAGKARNESIKNANGRYIAFCDSDDRWLPEKLEKQLRLMDEHDCALCSSSYLICNEEGQVVGVNYSPPCITLKVMKHDNKIGCLTAIYDIKRLGHKYYMPDIRKRQDWALFLNIMKDCRLCYCVTEPLALYSRHGKGSVSSDKMSLIKYNVSVYETVLGYSKFKSWLYFLFLFLPTYFLKIMKVKCDSRKYVKGENT